MPAANTPNTTNARSNRSGEIMLDTRYHVAIGGDPATNEPLRCIAGAPVLRNTSGAVGIHAVGAGAS